MRSALMLGPALALACAAPGASAPIQDPVSPPPERAEPGGDGDGAVGARPVDESGERSEASAGTLRLELHDDPDTFGDLRDPARVETLPGDADEVWIEGVGAGTYALMLHRDLDGDGELDRNFLGIPTEPVGFSNGYRPKGPPSFPRAAFDLGAGERRRFDVELSRPLGPRGQLGLGAAAVTWSSPYAGDGGTTVRAFPAIVYTGARFQVLGPRLDAQLVDLGSARVAATASYRFGAYEEDDSPALQGLGDREGTVMAGLATVLELPAGVELQVRYERDLLGEIGGGEGRAALRRSFALGNARLSPFAGMNHAEAELARHDYGVPASAAQAGRPRYDPGDTWTPELGLGLYFELSERWALAGSLSVELLPDDVRKSPIVEESEVLRGFLTLVYLL